MILIISEEKDASTNGVINWINHLGCEWIRINSDTDIQFIDLSMNDSGDIQFRLKKNGSEWISFSNITSVWYRRGGIYPSNFSSGNVTSDISKNPNKKAVVSQLKRESHRILEFIYTLLTDKPSIGSFQTGDVNKLISLYTARKIGLKIPSTKIVTNRSELLDFKEYHQDVITKSISESLYIKVENEFYCNYTETVSNGFIGTLADEFFPSLVQERLIKAYELRIFYLHGNCYSMAIFSQADQQTSVDFRKYNDRKPNRTLPFSLPQNIEEKIRSFMNAMNLNSGSIDMIVTTNKDYIFLEVNPVGQFGMVSGPCNYGLEKEIATCLIRMSLNSKVNTCQNGKR